MTDVLSLEITALPDVAQAAGKQRRFLWISWENIFKLVACFLILGIVHSKQLMI
ncbi:hypothetical protein [Paenibacillus sp. MMO-177]|uniref:hypothetical protein n=1 Tax=Paenibacillus sp. MMO-177 TaxID=3081289 RepID=UPI00301750D6